MKLANEQYEAAGKLREVGHYRASVSRSYYAAFAAAHAMLIRTGVSTPRLIEGTWSHRDLPTTFVNDAGVVRRFGRKSDRQAMLRAIRRLYSSRIEADYRPGIAIEVDIAAERLSDAHLFLNAAEGFV